MAKKRKSAVQASRAAPITRRGVTIGSRVKRTRKKK